MNVQRVIGAIKSPFFLIRAPFFYSQGLIMKFNATIPFVLFVCLSIVIWTPLYLESSRNKRIDEIAEIFVLKHFSDNNCVIYLE